MANNKEQLIKSVLDMKKAMADFFDAYTDMLMALPVFETAELVAVADTLETAGTLETPKTSEKVIPAKKSATKKSKIEKQEVDEADETPDETDGIYTKEALDGKKYNELKKIAKEVGVSAKGDRETLIDNILGASEQIEDEGDEDEGDEEETTLEDVEDEDDTDEDDGEEEDVEAEPIDDEESLAEEIEDRVSEMETEEIADLLVEAGISAKGKRQALINKLIKAVQDGAIAINGKDEDEEEPEDDDYEDEGDEDEGDEEDVNDLSNPNIKPARKKALKALKSMLEKKYNDGKLKAVTMKKALKAYYDESADEIDDMDNDELFDAYLQLKMLFIDDEGDEVEEGAPYTLNGEPYCCGQPLQYNEEDDTFICEICGGEYESEEE